MVVVVVRVDRSGSRSVVAVRLWSSAKVSACKGPLLMRPRWPISPPAVIPVCLSSRKARNTKLFAHTQKLLV